MVYEVSTGGRKGRDLSRRMEDVVLPDGVIQLAAFSLPFVTADSAGHLNLSTALMKAATAGEKRRPDKTRAG